MSRESMRRGAKEANEESDRLALGREMGKAVGQLAVFIKAIDRLQAQVDVLTKRVDEIDARTGSMVKLGPKPAKYRIPDELRVKLDPKP